jgi:hypothetical protein
MNTKTEKLESQTERQTAHHDSYKSKWKRLSDWRTDYLCTPRQAPLYTSYANDRPPYFQCFSRIARLSTASNALPNKCTYVRDR